eukprot:13734026-Ditylum_brightwellii.AAC.1
MSAWLSTRCSAVKAPLDYCTDGVKGNMQMVCFEWRHGITLREWVQSFDDTVTQKRRLRRSISLACKITQALSQIHEAGGVTVNNLSAEHIIVNDTQANHDSDEDDTNISVNIISLGSASLIH